MSAKLSCLTVTSRNLIHHLSLTFQSEAYIKPVEMTVDLVKLLHTDIPCNGNPHKHSTQIFKFNFVVEEAV